VELIQNFLSLFYKARAQDFVVHWLEPGQVPDGLGQAPIGADAEYLRIDLRALRVVHVQKGLTKFYGMVNSHITLPHMGQGEAEFQTVVAPPELKDVDAPHLDRFVSFNQPLAGPVPFRGGDVRIQVGLFSVASANLLSPYVSLLEEISSKCSVEFINVALPYAGLLAKGVGLLTGAGNPKTLEIGVSTVFDQVGTGWLLVMRADRTDFPPERLSRLSVNKDDSKLIEGKRPVVDYPYVILRISGGRTRDDWFKIPELRAQHELFRQVLRKGDRNEVQPALLAFERYLHTCPDLLTADAVKVADKARKDAERLYPATGTAAAEKSSGPAPLALADYAIYES
jgi:hypothetical protein